MPKKSEVPAGLVTDGEKWMWQQTDMVARVLNGFRTNIGKVLRFSHPELDQAVKDVHGPLRTMRRALTEYAEIRMQRMIPGYVETFPEQARTWDERLPVLKVRWFDAMVAAQDAINPLMAEYGRAVQEEA